MEKISIGLQLLGVLSPFLIILAYVLGRANGRPVDNPVDTDGTRLRRDEDAHDEEPSAITYGW